MSTVEVKTVLIFGGSGFIGYHLIKKLSVHLSWKIIIVCRDKSWSFDARTECLSYSQVSLIKHDRRKNLLECPELVNVRPHVIIDLSCYDAKTMRKTWDWIIETKQEPKKYILVSSDSVYEVCCKSDQTGPTKESHARRPSDKKQWNKLKRKDSYGNGKLAAEEVLHHHRGKCPALVLRLADVIGPRDSTNRFWNLMLYVRGCALSNLPFELESQLRDRPLSFIGVTDVAWLIEHACIESTFQGVYNAAANSTLTMEEIVTLVCNDLSCRIDVIYVDAATVPRLYPSVERGCIGVEKLCQTVPKWIATSLETVVHDAVLFYVAAATGSLHLAERQDIFNEFLDDYRDIFTIDTISQLKHTMLKLK